MWRGERSELLGEDWWRMLLDGLVVSAAVLSRRGLPPMWVRSNADDQLCGFYVPLISPHCTQLQSPCLPFFRPFFYCQVESLKAQLAANSSSQQEQLRQLQAAQAQDADARCEPRV